MQRYLAQGVSLLELDNKINIFVSILTSSAPVTQTAGI